MEYFFLTDVVFLHIMSVRYLQLILALIVASITYGQRTFNAYRTCDDITLDGILSEGGWGCSDETCDFTVNYPNVGDSSEFGSYVRILYDDEALYVGGIMYDVAPDSVSYALSQRDDFGNADYFGITIDPYANNQTAFAFYVTAAGVDLDALQYQERADYSWNAVWRSAAQRRADGWSFEMRIPFSAIRFPNKAIQEWNVNMKRQVRRRREMSFWNPLDPEIYGEITQSGVLIGIEDIKSPIRLSFSPYLTGYLENSYSASAGKQVWNSRLTGGMDLKYGLNDAFTLDMTLIPDFGQTRSDQQILNLGPFEVRFNENRPFFLEGMDLFSIGDIFYSRRIGGRPFNSFRAYEDEELDVLNNPQESPLINASKVSGRTKSGLGIGVFNAIEGIARATVVDSNGIERQVETNPFTNYNLFVLSQNLKNNGSVSFVNTNVLRNGSSRDANVSVFTSSLFSNDNSHRVDVTLKNSAIFEQDGVKNGHALNTRVSKVSGNVRYSLNYFEESDTYDPNDLGFLLNNNSRGYSGNLRLNDFEVGKVFLRKWFEVSAYYEELYKPQLFSVFDINWSAAGTFKNFLTAGLSGRFSPVGYVNHFESRQFGEELVFGPSYRVGGFYSSDYSKVFALDLRASYSDFTQSDQYNYSLTFSPRIRFGDIAFMVWNTTYNGFGSDIGYISVADDNYADQLLMGIRDRAVVENRLSAQIIFTNRMGVDIQLRHYWQQVDYTRFVELRDEGELVSSDYFPLNDYDGSVHNTSYNAFTLDVNYRWVFFPGCELSVFYKNNIFNAKQSLDPTYFNTFESLFDQPQINSLSMRVLVFIDAIYFRGKQKRTGTL